MRGIVRWALRWWSSAVTNYTTSGSAERTFTVIADTRTFTVAADTRGFTVAADTRTFEVTE